jgi:cytochrome bd-type quinol oxidase subunit 2
MDLSWGLFVPLLLAALAYGVAAIVAAVMASRDNEAGAERVRDGGFVIALAAGVWVLVLLVLAMIGEPDDLWDMVVIALVIVAFFAILLVVLFAIALLVGRVSSSATRRRRVTTDKL